MGPHCKRIPKAQVQPWNDKTISNSPALKREKGSMNRVYKNYSVQVNIVYKMTVCMAQREFEDNLQEHGLQFSFACTRAIK